MRNSGDRSPQLLVAAAIAALMITVAHCEDLFYDWRVALDTTIRPVSSDQPVITINGMFPGPLINATTNDNIHANVFNDMDEPLLFTWNGIQQRLNSWQDGVSGTNCPIMPGKNWTYVFQVKDQIGTFFYFPSINFQKAGGGFGPIRVNNRKVIKVPFPRPEAQFDLLIGDWFRNSYKEIRSNMKNKNMANHIAPDGMLINGKVPYQGPTSTIFESFTVTQGKTYMLRISNVGTTWSFNFRIQGHQLLVVETEGSYVNQTTVDSLDVHVGQSYSILVTANQTASDYYIVASPKMVYANQSSGLVGIGILHYDNSSVNATGPLPSGPDPFDLQFSVNQARSIRWDLTVGAARPNPQGTFNVSNVTLWKTFVIGCSKAEINGDPYYTINDVSYRIPDTPLKLADHFVNGSGFFEVDKFSTNSSNGNPQLGLFVAAGEHKGWLEIVLKNELDTIDSWHLDGFSFFVVGFGNGSRMPQSRSTYNLHDALARSTTQVYPGGWTAVYAYLDNPGMWNLRSQNLRNWYLGQEMFLRVYDPDPNLAKERPPPSDLLLCGNFSDIAPTPAPSPVDPPTIPPATPSPPPSATPSALTLATHSPPPPATPSTPPPPATPSAAPPPVTPSHSLSSLQLVARYNLMICLASILAIYSSH